MEKPSSHCGVLENDTPRCTYGHACESASCDDSLNSSKPVHSLVLVVGIRGFHYLCLLPRLWTNLPHTSSRSEACTSDQAGLRLNSSHKKLGERFFILCKFKEGEGESLWF